ncbi:MAG TPA: AMP-binding protein [Pseudonocardia sp.]|nr:AMP-binding protein [Pseudonocardia sp.]
MLAGNVADLVAAAAGRGPDHPALLEPAKGLVLSWAALDAAADAEADRLAAAGVGAGDRVLIRLGHGARFCVALFGALRIGAIAVPVGTHSTGRELTAIVVDCVPSVLVAEPGDTAVAAAVSVGGPAESARLLAAPDPVAGSTGGGAASTGVRRQVVGGGEDIAVLGYTSGTTGVPRGVRLSHRALLANRAQTAQLRPVPVSPADRVLLHLPLFHIYGLGAGLLQVCWSGATGVLVERVDPGAVVEVIRTERVTVLAGVPSMYRAMLELPAQRLRDALVSVRLCTAGGAPLAPDLLHGFRETTGLDLFEGYGLTETGPVLTTTLVSGLAKPGSVGRPLPGGPGVAGVELRLVDAADRPADGDPAPGGANPGTDGSDPGDGSAGDNAGPPARRDDDPNDFGDEPDDLDDDHPDTGLVSVRGPNLFSGYWPDGAGGPDADGWFRTSDVGFVDSDGDLHLVDRANDLVIVNGFNVYPHEVEQVLNEHPSIAEAAVVGVPDPRTGEAVKAVLVLRPGAELTVEQLREHCVTRLARFKIPTVVQFADQLPHSATGKITRLALREEGHS